MTASEMHARAMLVKLTITAWSAKKYDKKVTRETNETHGATQDAGRYNKNLMPSDAESYKALNSHISAMRMIQYGNTLPWSDDGWRLLPVKNYQTHTDLVNQGQHTFNRLLSEFLADYPNLKQTARERLNGMFREDDYPSDLQGLYSIKVEYAPVPRTEDFRVTLPSEEIALIASRTEERVQAAFKAAQADAVNRLFDVLSKIRERLTSSDVCSNCDGTGATVETRNRVNKGQNVTCWQCDGCGRTDAKFHDTLIENAREVCDALTRLNVADDPRLEEFRAQAEQLAKTSPQTLRELPHVRQATAQGAQSILDAMQATFGAQVIA